MRFNIHRLGFTVFLAGLSALPPLAIDMALPSLALVQADLHASQTQAASAIAIFLAGFATAPLAVGPLSDRFGRKPIMLAGLLLFTLCALGCALSPSIGALLAFRLFQGVGAGSVGILPRAIIRDLFEGRESRLHIAAVSLVFSIAPLIAPTIGAAILTAGPWRLIYVVLTAVGAVLATVGFALFEESHPLGMRRNLMPATLLAGYRRALTSPMCVGFALVNGLVFAGLFAYVNISPLLFIQGYGVSKAGFAGLFAITASGVIVGSTINTWLVRWRARPKAVLDAALAVISLAALTLLAIGLGGAGSPLIVAAPVMVYISSFGLVFPNAAHEAVQPLPEIAGLASAVLVATQMLFGALGGAAAAALYRDASPLAIGEVMSVGTLSASALYAFWLRPGVED
ncbi:MAG: multidrug effflux MFS transporter [Roseiarcus sp.]|uniref:multidrug effflux MFS transporter n=1 Tax=Roseiarcus sp. TaxID=1969460 RepID=UPI003BAFB919